MDASLLGKSIQRMAAEAAAELGSPHPGSRPPAAEAWETGEVVRLVSGAGLGIHAGWQALVGRTEYRGGGGEGTLGVLFPTLAGGRES